jgi:hypothetical protein
MTNQYNILLLSIVKFIHVIISEVIPVFYIFIFPVEYDIYLAIIGVLQGIHWLVLKYECIISYIEKLIINPNYELGSDPTHMPHLEIYPNETIVLMKFFYIMLVMCYIYYRNQKNITVRVLIIVTALVNIYFGLVHSGMKKIKKDNAQKNV